MKVISIFISCLILFIKISFSQTHQTELFIPNYLELTEKRFIGGKDGFLKHFYLNIKYPGTAREKHRVGQLLINLTISPNGELKEIKYLNHLGEGIEEAVSDVLSKTKGQWIATTEESSINFSVAFQMGDDPEIEGDIKVVAYGNGDCLSNKEVELKFYKAMKKNKRKIAMELCEELIRRNPFSGEYKKMYADF